MMGRGAFLTTVNEGRNCPPINYRGEAARVFWQRGVDPRSLAQREAALGTIAPPNNPAAISEGCANESRFHQLSIIDGRHSRRPFSREIIDGMPLAAYLPRFTQGYRIRSRSNSSNRPRQLPNPIDYLGKSAIDYRGHAHLLSPLPHRRPKRYSVESVVRFAAPAPASNCPKKCAAALASKPTDQR
jgi:hypothetical protein